MLNPIGSINQIGAVQIAVWVGPLGRRLAINLLV
jgi:hypothetical protein